MADVSRHMTLEERYERAITKARALRLHSFEVQADRLYRVRSQRAGQPAHYIALTVRGLICDCEASRAGQPCVHAAAVYLRRLREQRPTRAYAPLDTAQELEFDDDGDDHDSGDEQPEPQRPQKRPTLQDIFY